MKVKLSYDYLGESIPTSRVKKRWSRPRYNEGGYVPDWHGNMTACIEVDDICLECYPKSYKQVLLLDKIAKLLKEV